MSQLESERKALDLSLRTASPRRELLQVLHTARLLDSFLSAFLASNAITFPPPKSMGSYLKGLRNHHRPNVDPLPEHRRNHHDKHVIRIRNHFLHQAGAFPTKKQADELVSSMQVCLAEVANLER